MFGFFKVDFKMNKILDVVVVDNLFVVRFIKGMWIDILFFVFFILIL